MRVGSVETELREFKMTLSNECFSSAAVYSITTSSTDKYAVFAEPFTKSSRRHMSAPTKLLRSAVRSQILCVCGRKLSRQLLKSLQFSMLISFVTFAFISSCFANTIPRFNSDTTTIDQKPIPEDTPVGTVIGMLRGIDPDPDADLTFGVVGDGTDIVTIEKAGPLEARVRLKRKLDREAASSHSLRLTLTDGIISQPIVQEFVLYVSDVNDEVPEFIRFNSTLFVREDAPPGTIIGEIEARDRDQGVFGLVHFLLTNHQDKFSVETVNQQRGIGRIKLIGTLDYEAEPVYQLRIVAEDGPTNAAPADFKRNRASLSVVVQVQDVQDTAPQFVRFKSVVRVSEDIAVGEPIMQVEAQDGDRGIPNPIFYTLLPKTAPFKIDEITGVISASRPLDREAYLTESGGTIILTVIATEITEISNNNIAGGTSHLGASSSVEVSVIIEDVNDMAPIFLNGSYPVQHYNASIREDAGIGVAIMFEDGVIPRVVDFDQGLNGTIRMSLSSNVQQTFDVYPTTIVNDGTFIIRVKNNSLLDFEQTNKIEFQVIAAETYTKELYSGTATVTLSVIDVNDNIPYFVPPAYEASVSENSPPGTFVLQLQAFDADSSGAYGTIAYTRLEGQNAAAFALDSKTGIVTVAQPTQSNAHVLAVALDRELTQQVFLTAEARDDHGRGNRQTALVKINILDVNDNAPVFDAPLYEANLIENELNFTRPLFVRATERDDISTTNGQIRYTIASNASPSLAGYFAVNERGEVRPVKPLDFEQVAAVSGGGHHSAHHHDSGKKTIDSASVAVQLQLVAMDHGEPKPLSTQVPLIVHLLDANDNAPTFDEVSYQAWVAENAASGTLVQMVHATDADASSYYGRIVYRVEKGAQDKFTIDANTGAITVAAGAVLDRDVQAAYKLQVVAIDGGVGKAQRTGTAQVNVVTVDVNNKPPIFLPIPPIVVGEGEVVGHTIDRIQAVDPDESHHLVYKLVDFVDPEDEDDNRVSPAHFNYSAAFVLREDGVLLLGAPLDREKLDHIKIIVQVADVNAQTNAPQTATATLTLSVGDVNDNDPYFVLPQETNFPFYYNSVVENFVPTTPIITLQVRDADKSTRHFQFSFYNLSSTLSEYLDMDRDSGRIYLKRSIDREQFSWLNFTVVVNDSGTTPTWRAAMVDVRVRIADENDNNPEWVILPPVVYLREDAPVGLLVTTVLARDRDLGPYGEVTYVLDQSTAYGQFEIGFTDGQIRVRAPLDREARETYTLSVSAVDDNRAGLNPFSRRTTGTINVVLVDVNDNAPVIEPLSATFNANSNAADDANVIELSAANIGSCIELVESDAANTLVYRLRASDADKPGTPNSDITFSIIGGNGSHLFDIRPKTGEILTRVPLQNHYGYYWLNVQASDGGGTGGVNSLSTNRTFHVCVADVNDHAPEFVYPGLNDTIAIFENATTGTRIVQVKAIDRDVGENAEVHFRLTATDVSAVRGPVSPPSSSSATFGEKSLAVTDAFFAIDENSGWLSLEGQLDYERARQHTVYVEAYDGGYPTQSTRMRILVHVINVNDNPPLFRDTREQVFSVRENAGPQTFLVMAAFDADDEVSPPSINHSSAHHHTIFGSNYNSTCYFIVGGADRNDFVLNKRTRELRLIRSLDREEVRASAQQSGSVRHVIVKAMSNCTYKPQSEKSLEWDPKDLSLLLLTFNVEDENDNPPRFKHKEYTAGVTVESKYGSRITQLMAEDADAGRNAKITYAIVGGIKKTLNQNEHFHDQPFVIDADTGEVRLNVKFPATLKGYFDFKVIARNEDNRLNDTATVFIYLLRNDQRVQFTLLGKPEDVRILQDRLRDVLTNLTGAKVSVDDILTHVDESSNAVNDRYSDVLMHFVDAKTERIMDADMVVQLIDETYDKLEAVFKEFNIVEVQRAELKPRPSTEGSTLRVLLGSISSALLLLLAVAIMLFFIQRSRYTRKLRAATALAFASDGSSPLFHNHLMTLDGAGGLTSAASLVRIKPTQRYEVPGTNLLNCYEGANPIWRASYADQAWTQAHDTQADTDTVSESNSKANSIDENVVPPPPRVAAHSSTLPDRHMTRAGSRSDNIGTKTLVNDVTATLPKALSTVRQAIPAVPEPNSTLIRLDGRHQVVHNKTTMISAAKNSHFPKQLSYQNFDPSSSNENDNTHDVSFEEKAEDELEEQVSIRTNGPSVRGGGRDRSLALSPALSSSGNDDRPENEDDDVVDVSISTERDQEEHVVRTESSRTATFGTSSADGSRDRKDMALKSMFENPAQQAVVTDIDEPIPRRWTAAAAAGRHLRHDSHISGATRLANIYESLEEKQLKLSSPSAEHFEAKTEL